MNRRVLASLAVASLVSTGCTDRDQSETGASGEGTTGTTGATSTTGAATETTSTTGDPEFGPCPERPPGGGEPGSPQLMAAGFQGAQAIRLQFSEPIAAVDDVDPSSFRLSVGVAYDDPDYGQRTIYEDPMLFLCSRTDACFGDYVDVVDIGCDSSDPSVVFLGLDIWSEYICPLIDDSKMYDQSIDILPHYRAAAPPIRDLDGEPLESFGAHWVDNPDLGTQRDGIFADLDPYVPIPCPG